MFGIYLIVGACAGLMAGLFGIGGGVIIIPALAAIFLHHTDIPAELVMQMAVGTSLATVVITAISSVYAHHRHQAVIWPQVWVMVPWLIVGTVLGAAVVSFLPSSFLRLFFAIFLTVLSIHLFFSRTPSSVEKVLSDKVVKIGSIIIGVLSSILGVGGGTLLVPFLMRCKLDILQATGTSVACGFAVSMVASICFMVTGWLSGIHLQYSTGYIYWPAFAGIAVASVLFAPLGAAFAHKLPKEMLKRIFAVFLLMMAADMMFFSR